MEIAGIKIFELLAQQKTLQECKTALKPGQGQGQGQSLHGGHGGHGGQDGQG